MVVKYDRTYRPIHLNVDADLLGRLDEYKSSNMPRSRLIHEALEHYLEHLDMTTEITVSGEVSVLLSPEGIDIYVGEDFNPTDTYSFDLLVNEYLDAFADSDELNEELETLVANLENVVEKLRAAI